VVVEVKALACELPRSLGVPLSRFSIPELREEAIRRGIVASVSGSTIWRWLSQDAIKPWRHRSWIFPRDPDFAEKAGRVLDLYHREWEGKPLKKADFVICADEKTSIQARIRRHPSLAPSPGDNMRVEHEYERGGSLAYLAALDVHRTMLFGRCEQRSGIEPFDRLVEQVMESQPYRSAKRVFWIVDNGSSHRGDKAAERLRARWKNIVPVHLPIHASWLNQIEIYFSVVQRKVLNPSDFSSLQEVEDRLLSFQERYQEVASPFEWRFTRTDLERLIDRLDGHHGHHMTSVKAA
jgi:transposase